MERSVLVCLLFSALSQLIGIFERKLTFSELFNVFAGLFVGAGSALASAGTVGCWLGYVIMSGIVWTMMTALGEVSRKLFHFFWVPSHSLSASKGWILIWYRSWNLKDDYDVPC